MNTHHHYLRLLRTLALATLTAAAVAACTDDNGDPSGREPLTPPDGADGIPVSFTANINPGSDADPDTRTVLKPDGNGGFTVTWKAKNDYPNNFDLLYIWAVKGNTPENNGSPKYYVPTTSAASSELVPYEESDKLTLSSEGSWMFTAIYGHRGGGGVGLSAATVSPLRQSAPNNTEHIASQDFSVATDTKTVAAGNDMPTIVNFKFKHLLAALQLRVTNQTGEALTVREIRLSAAGGQITSSKKYNVVTGGWSADGEQKSDYLKLEIENPAELASGGTAQDFHMLLFPGYAGTNMTITVITSRGEYTLTKTAPASPGFEAGTNYMTNIAIKSTNLDPDKETWTEYVDITNKTELIAFRDKVNNGNNYSGKTVRLTADIDLANETWTTPIGSSAYYSFKGTFDGGGYLISNLSVDNGSNDDAGLFSNLIGSTVRNLRVSGTVTTTGSNAGGIAGYLKGSTMENCIFDGNVRGNSNVGGIAGNSQENSRIAGCHTKGSVTATNNAAGGIAGLNTGSTIDGCYSEANVTARNYAGGIVGNSSGSGKVTRCYATGKVSGTYAIGGIVGFNNGTLTGCIALNPGLTRTADSDTKFGRVVGYNDGSTPTSCAAYEGMTFTDGTTSQPFTGATGPAGDNLTREQCVTGSTYTSRGFTEPTATTPGWAFDTAATWAYLPWNPAFWSFPGITTTETDSYRIRVPQHLSGSGTVN